MNRPVFFVLKLLKTLRVLRFNMGEPFTSDFKITTREPSFVMHGDDDKMKAHSSSKSDQLFLRFSLWIIFNSDWFLEYHPKNIKC